MLETKEFVILWHHHVHERRFGQSLVYFQLSFVPVYRRDDISTALHGLFVDHGISSFCLYETYGLYDILIRAWLPQGLPAQKFVQSVKDALRNLGCTRVLPFFVSQHLHHWKWCSEEDGTMALPGALKIEGLSDEIVRRVQEPEPAADLVNQLEAHQLIRRVDHHNNGIKFFVVIPPPMLGVVPPEDMERRICENLRRLLCTSESISEPSMYLGDGFAWILIKARMAQDAYGRIDSFIQRINMMGVEGFYIRTYTYLATGSAAPYSMEQEKLGSQVAENSKLEMVDLERCLARGEDDLFEVKGTLKANFDRFVREKSHPVVAEDRLALEGALKTIVAFLNSQGGELLIGAVEKRHYENALREDSHPLRSSPVVGDWIICGLDLDFKQTRDFDGFRLLLTDLIKAHIGSDASALVSIQHIKYRDKDLALVRVPKGLGWYYLANEKFFVRRSGSTIALDGHDRDRYRGASVSGGYK